MNFKSNNLETNNFKKNFKLNFSPIKINDL